MNSKDTELENTFSSCYEPFFVARQPIFNSNMDIWGYEFLFRNSLDTNEACIMDQDRATSNVIIDGYSVAQRGLHSNTKICLNFSRNTILEGSAYALPSDRVIIEILETILPEKQILKECIEHKKRGFQLALDDFTGQPELEKFLKLIDFVKVDVLNLSKKDITNIVNRLQDYPCTIIAEKVEDMEMLELTKKTGCSLFQGFFFSKPEILPGRSIQSNQTVKLRLLKVLNNQKDYDPEKLGKIIQSDLSLSYRLIKFINSPGLGLVNKISSIKHAINLLGYERIFHWIRVLILADLNTSPRGEELTFRSAQRGRFLQLITEGRDTKFDTDGMFLLGLFSLLDSILDQPMQEILRHLPLEDTLANTLLGENTEPSVWLNLVVAQEKAHWQKVREMIAKLNLTPEDTADCYIHALNWTNDLLFPQQH